MKKLILLFTLFISISTFANTMIENLSKFIGGNVSTFETELKVIADDKKANFNKVKQYYKLKVEGEDCLTLVESESNIITRIVLLKKNDNTTFFMNEGEYLNKVKTEGNFYIYVERNISGDKKFFQNLDSLIKALQNGDYNLQYYVGAFQTYKIDGKAINLRIDDESSIITIEKE